MSAPITVGVDFSEPGRAAFEAAIRLAQDLQTSLALVHAFPSKQHAPALVSDSGQGVVDAAHAEISRKEALRLSQEWAAEARATGLDVQTVAEEGPPRDLLLRVAKELGAAMIVVGTHGRTGLKHLLLGSVAEDLVRHSDRPVLVVP